MKQLSFLTEIGESLEVSSDIFDYRPNIFTEAECKHYLRIFTQQVPWQQTYQRIYDKVVITPRLNAWFGDPHTNYSSNGESSPKLIWTPELLAIKLKVEAISAIKFNSVLLNYYRDHKDSVGWHSDRDGASGRNQYVASISFGEERIFELRRIDDPAKKFSVLLENGSYLLMKGEFQDSWQHRIAKSKVPMKERINLTFRITHSI